MKLRKDFIKISIFVKSLMAFLERQDPLQDRNPRCRAPQNNERASNPWDRGEGLLPRIPILMTRR